MLRTRGFHCHGPGSIPSHEAKQKKKKKKKDGNVDWFLGEVPGTRRGGEPIVEKAGRGRCSFSRSGTQTDGEARISCQALLVTVSGGTESWEQSDTSHCHPRLIVRDRQQSPRVPSYWAPNEVRDFGAEQGKRYDHKVAVAHKEFSLEADLTGLHVRRVLAT